MAPPRPKDDLRPRRRMQDVRFDSVDACLDYLPEDERRLAERLRSIILDTLPEVNEKLTYNVPFYHRHSNICFLWPGSVPWGQVRARGVRLGFNRGHLLLDETGYLEAGNRKQVFVRDHYTIADIDEPRMQALLLQALLVDEERALQKKKER